jgi:hypothetical protein
MGFVFLALAQGASNPGFPDDEAAYASQSGK